MLVLTRRPGEQIVLDDGRIVMTFLGIEGNKLRIGIDAPPDVRVDRKEVHDRRVAEADKEPIAQPADKG